MKRIPIICFVAFITLACQAITGIATPKVSSSNTPKAVVEDKSINILPSFSNSDIVFISARDLQVYTMDQNGNNAKKLTDFNTPLLPISIKWSPDKKQIAFIQLADDRYFSVFIMNSNGADLRPINATFLDLELTGFEWSPDGKTIAIWGSSGFYVINVLNGEIGYQEKLEKPGYYYHSAAWSPDNKEIAIGTLEGIFIVDVERNTAKQTINPPGILNSIIWSPNGQEIAFSADNLPTCKDDFFCSGIFIMNFDGSELRPLTDKTDNNYKVRDWSPDGNYILFDAAKSISLIRISDSEMVEISKDSYQSVLSEDGQYVLYAYTSSSRICKKKIEQLIEICLTDDSNGGFSPDW